jgi:predicted  nucleic acid-binding Zn-ribbon protein
MIPALAALIELQDLDSAAERTRRRLAEFPALEGEIATQLDAARSRLEAAKAESAENQQARRALEKDVAQVDTRLARFDDHKAAVKTNQEYTALLHEISVAKAEKDGIEDRILGLMEAADLLTANVKASEAGVAEAVIAGDSARKALLREREDLEREISRLSDERRRVAATLEAPLIGKYDQLLKQRRGVAVALMQGETCSACHVRLRPTVAQQVRRNDAIISCDSCQRILYVTPKPAPPEG